MDVQLIIVIIIVSACFGIAINKIFKRFFNSSSGNNVCEGCSGCDIKEMLKKKQEECIEKKSDKKKCCK